MKLLLRIYLFLLFISFSLEAGTENNSINSVFPLEETNFASSTIVPIDNTNKVHLLVEGGVVNEQESSTKLDLEIEKCLSEVGKISKR